MKRSRMGVFLTLAASVWIAQPAAACIQAGDLRQAFFGARPAEVPKNLVVLKVEAPNSADENSAIVVKLLEPADRDSAGNTIVVRVDPPNGFGCDIYDLGLLGQPAYIFGVYERSGDGPTYFRALWLRRDHASLKRQAPWTSYIVDPDLRARAEATRK